MIPSNLISKYIFHQLFSSSSKGQAVSLPVLLKKDGLFYVACFISLINPIGFDDTLPRPEYWVVADLSSGDIIEFNDCRLNDFTDADFNKRFNIESNLHHSSEYFQDAFALLDQVREELLDDGLFNRRIYKLYLKKITQYAPLSYRKFFRDLSI